MKNLFIIVVFALSSILYFSSCSSSQGGVASSSTNNSSKLVGEGQLNNNLADLLRKNTSLNIKGQHPNVNIDIRGINTIKGDSRPFFVIDGVSMGRSYAQANNAVNLNNVKRIRILKSLSELAVYGEDGVNGVIIIEHAN